MYKIVFYLNFGFQCTLMSLCCESFNVPCHRMLRSITSERSPISTAFQIGHSTCTNLKSYLERKNCLLELTKRGSALLGQAYVSFVRAMETKKPQLLNRAQLVFLFQIVSVTAIYEITFGYIFYSTDKMLLTKCPPELSETQLQQANRGLLRGSSPAALKHFPIELFNKIWNQNRNTRH